MASHFPGIDFKIDKLPRFVNIKILRFRAFGE
jgi:hypothetical protein